MNKQELIQTLAANSGLTQKDTTLVLDNLVRIIENECGKGEAVRILGFGTFSVKETPARTVRNPQTGEMIQIEARRLPKFSPGSDFKAAVAK